MNIAYIFLQIKVIEISGRVGKSLCLSTATEMSSLTSLSVRLKALNSKGLALLSIY